MIKAVIFDFAQTLVDSSDGCRVAEKIAQKKIFDDLCLSSWEDFLAIYRRIRKDFHEDSKFSRKAIWQEVYLQHQSQSDSSILEKWQQDYWKMVMTKTVVFPEVWKVLAKLSRRYRLAVITNTEGRAGSEKHRINRLPKLKSFFDKIIIAGESEIHPKPDSASFCLCLKQLGISPSEAVYVGDDLRIDVCGATNVGIQPIWLKHHLINRNWPTAQMQVPTITSLEQLLDIELLC